MTSEMDSVTHLEQSGQRSVTVDEPIRELLTRIEIDQHGINACISTTSDLALRDAARVQHAREVGRPLPLDGMALVIKDNIDVGGTRTTRGAKWFYDRVARTDATVIRRLRAAGGIIVGKANMHEFAYGGTSNNPHFGAVRNPWDLTRIPGGSSGGSAAAIAAGWVPAALGTDTAGSVRCPAALCGVSGLRPTMGVVSNYGVFPLGPSFDTVGPMAARVADVAKVFGVIVGDDLHDVGSQQYLGSPFLGDGGNAWAGIRVGVPRTYFFEDLEPAVASATERALDVLADLGANVVEVSAPGAARAREVASSVAKAEALAIHHDRMAREPRWFGDDVAELLELGRRLSGWQLAEFYLEMRKLRMELRALFSTMDVVVTPTVPVTAPRIDECETIAATVSEMRLTFPWSLAHVPALSVPCGYSPDGLPVGLQVVGGPHMDGLLCALGCAYQEVTDWHLRRPPVVDGPLNLA